MHFQLIDGVLAIAVGALDHQLAGVGVLFDAGKGHHLAAVWTRVAILLLLCCPFHFPLLLLLGGRDGGFCFGVLVLAWQPVRAVSFLVDHLVAGVAKDGTRLVVTLHPHPSNKY